MPKPKHIIVVGGGPGGLCAAMILAHRGFRVTVFEKDPELGGRNAPLCFDGFTFDRGPTFLMMRFLLEEMFLEAGRRAEDYLRFHRLDPMYRLIFDDREVLVSSHPEKTRRELGRAFPGVNGGFDEFLRREGRRFERLYPCIQKD